LEGQMLNMRVHSEWLGERPKEILVTGGGSKSDQICQVIADVFGAKVMRLKNAGSASLGAAMMAAVGAEVASLGFLEATLCGCDEETVIEPRDDVNSLYSDLAQDFCSLLKTAQTI